MQGVHRGEQILAVRAHLPRQLVLLLNHLLHDGLVVHLAAMEPLAHVPQLCTRLVELQGRVAALGLERTPAAARVLVGALLIRELLGLLLARALEARSLRLDALGERAHLVLRLGLLGVRAGGALRALAQLALRLLDARLLRLALDLHAQRLVQRRLGTLERLHLGRVLSSLKLERAHVGARGLDAALERGEVVLELARVRHHLHPQRVALLSGVLQMELDLHQRVCRLLFLPLRLLLLRVQLVLLLPELAEDNLRVRILRLQLRRQRLLRLAPLEQLLAQLLEPRALGLELLLLLAQQPGALGHLDEGALLVAHEHDEVAHRAQVLAQPLLVRAAQVVQAKVDLAGAGHDIARGGEQLLAELVEVDHRHRVIMKLRILEPLSRVEVDLRVVLARLVEDLLDQLLEDLFHLPVDGVGQVVLDDRHADLREDLEQLGLAEQLEGEVLHLGHGDGGCGDRGPVL